MFDKVSSWRSLRFTWRLNYKEWDRLSGEQNVI
jgi:hypothetical protein